MLIAALKSRFANAMRTLPLVELTIARIPRTCVLCSTTVSTSSRQASTFSRLPVLFFFAAARFPLLDERRKEDFFLVFGQPAMRPSRIRDFHLYTLAFLHL